MSEKRGERLKRRKEGGRVWQFKEILDILQLLNYEI